jgi:hypothetical protein
MTWWSVAGLDREAVPDDAGFVGRWSTRTGLCGDSVRRSPCRGTRRRDSAGRLTTEEIVAASERFLASGLLVRWAECERRRPLEWSTVEHRASRIDSSPVSTLAATRAGRVGVIEWAIAPNQRLA